MNSHRLRLQTEDTPDSLCRIMANTTLYRMLDEAQLEQVAAATWAARLPGNRWVVGQGEAAKGIYLVAYGRVRLGFQRTQGSEKTLAILSQGNCFGLIETMLGRTFLAGARTVGDTMLLYTASEAIKDAANVNPAFSRALTVCVSRQSYVMMRDIKDYSLHTARQRVAGYLLRHRSEDEGGSVELAIGKNVVASCLNLTPETFSRLLRELAEQGAISVIGRRVRILDAGKLLAEAG